MNTFKRFSPLLLILVILLTPTVIKDNYTFHLLIMVAIYVVMTQGLNLIFGYTGFLSFGQQAYLAIGAYVSAMLALRLGLSFWVTWPLAILATVLVGLFIGFVTLRLRGAYFVIVTIGFAEVVRLLPMNIDALGGPPGLRGLPTPNIHIGNLININFEGTKIPYFYLAWAMALFAIFIVNRLVNSRQGRAFLAIRENDSLAQAVGINIFKYSIFSFTVSVALAGAAGAFFGHYVTHISPEISAFHWTLSMILMVVVGGQGTIWGPVIGSFIFTLLPEWLRAAEQLRLPIYGVLLILAVLFMPNGVLPWLRKIWHQFTEKTRKAPPEAGSSPTHQASS
ncbi:MAG: branched-chain amino acid ABC transporter permease [Anaerolineaceae bacterium]|nr:branched-chain amino acid ABC transporter permease [Anaerolineaceae bacterium]